MRLSITSDEISLDLASALEIVNEQQCREFEIRALGLETLPDVDERWLVQADKAVLKRMRITALAPRFFLDGAPATADCQKLFAIAKRLKCNLISIFCMKRPPEEVDAEKDDDEEDDDAVVLPPAESLKILQKFVADATRENCEVALRPHPETYAGTAREALALIAALGADAKALGLDWDVGQCFAAGDDSGLESLPDVLPHLKAVRMRDAIRRGMGADWASLGKGVIPWEDILQQLYDGGYRGPVILEAGVAPKLKESRAALALAGRWIGACRFKSQTANKDDEEENQETEWRRR